MSVTYHQFDGCRVSTPWRVVLGAARRAGVQFRVTSGHRTMAEQQRLRSLYLAGRGALAAVPSSSAPHIRTGRVDHAIDVNALDGGARRLAAWLRSRGVRVSFPVPGEPWHMEVPAADLRAAARKLADPLAAYPAKERKAIRTYDDWKRRNVNPVGRARLRREMRVMRKRVWRAAQKSGWQKLNRQARYRSLLARSR